MKTRAARNQITSLSEHEIFALHVASHYKLRRSSMGWWAENHPRWDVSEPVVILRPVTIKALWRKGLLDGTPDFTILGARQPARPPARSPPWRKMVRAGLMSQREFDKRIPTRDLARRIRQRDNTPGAWPRDPKIQIGRSTPTTGDRTDPVVGASLSEGETKH